jgi:hypothetical protein
MGTGHDYFAIWTEQAEIAGWEYAHGLGSCLWRWIVGLKELELDAIGLGLPENIVMRIESVCEHELTWNSKIKG